MGELDDIANGTAKVGPLNLTTQAPQPTTGGKNRVNVTTTYNVDTGETNTVYKSDYDGAIVGPPSPTTTTSDTGYTPAQMDGDYSWEAATTDRIDGDAATVGKDYTTEVTNVDTSALDKPDVAQADTYGYTPTEAKATGYNATLGEATGYTPGLLNGAADYQASLAQASTWDAYNRAVEANDLARTHLESMLSEDSDYMKQARTAGVQYANSRGLLNTIMAGRAAQGAAIERAAPIALNDAQVYDRRALADMQYTNQSRSENANNQTRVSLANAGFENDASQFRGENLRFDTSATNDANRFNAGAINAQTLANQDYINEADKFNAGAENEFSIYNNSAYAQSLRDLAAAQNETSRFNSNQSNTNNFDWAGLIAGLLDNNANRSTNAAMQDTRTNADADQFDVRETNDWNKHETGTNATIDMNNADNKNEASRDNSDKDFNKDQINVTEDNDARSQKSEQEFRKWENDWQLQAESKRDAWNQKYDMEKLEYQKISNMQQDYISTMRDTWKSADAYIRDVQTSTNMDADTKTQLINEAITMRDQGMRLLSSIYDELPGWDESWNAMPDDKGRIDLEGSAEAVAQWGGKVQELFNNQLGRDPSEEDMAYYASEIAAGRKSPADVERELGGSEEARTNAFNEATPFVRQAFSTILGRDATQADVEWYAGQIAQGKMTKEQMRVELLKSPELRDNQVKNGKAKPTEFSSDINQVYKTLLGRDADAGGLEWFGQKMAEGWTLQQVSDAIRSSDEFVNRG